MRLGVCPVVYPEMNLSDKTEGTLMVDIEKVKAALDEIRPARGGVCAHARCVSWLPYVANYP
jgi:hypothetical protein